MVEWHTLFRQYAIPTEIHIDRHVITLYIHILQWVTISCVVHFLLNIEITELFADSYC